MPTKASILADLKSKGKENTRKIYARHGMPADRVYGVSVADLKPIAKSVKGQQSLALELYSSGIMDAMYLAGMVADGAQMTRKQINEWADGAAEMQMIAEYTVPWVAVDNEHGRELALEWMKSKKERVAAAGWSTYSGLVALKPDDALDLKEIQSLLDTVVEKIHTAPNRVRYTMNVFVISVGSYVKPLMKQARAAAKKIGEVSVEMGDTACKVPLATAYIEKVEAAGKLGQKRKTIRC
ncbi:MAG: DNA alkylation repair protein [Terracidiphilus sp.]|jgi:3-methyladenine DNA glycosylase AlkD